MSARIIQAGPAAIEFTTGPSIHGRARPDGGIDWSDVPFPQRPGSGHMVVTNVDRDCGTVTIEAAGKKKPKPSPRPKPGSGY